MKNIFYGISGYLKEHRFYVVVVIIVFYIVGFTGIVLPFTNPLFMELFPVALILSILVLLFFHEGKIDSLTIITLLVIGLAGYLIEVAGVNTGILFGPYAYGESFGMKVFNTPLLIGANWLMLTYAFAAITEEINIPLFAKSLLASLFMVAYDIVLELIAPLTDMWRFENATAPLRNYIAWFLIAMIFQSVIRLRGGRIKNSIAAQLVLIQFCFFVAQIVFFKLVK